MVVFVLKKRLFFFLGLFFLTNFLRADFSFLADSDMQLGGAGPEETKKGHVQAIIDLIQDERRSVKALLIPGDLIEGIPAAANSNSYLAKGAEIYKKLELIRKLLRK